MGQEYGFKGFGLAFAAFISKEFYIASRPFTEQEQTNEFSLSGLFNWLSDDEGTAPFPNAPIPDTRAAQSAFDNDWRTLVRVKLANDYAALFPAVSSADQAFELLDKNGRKGLEGFKFLLRTRTAIGNTKVLFSKSPIVPIDVKLDIMFSDDDSEKDITIPFQYYHPKDHEQVNVASYDFRDYDDQLKRTTFNRNFRGLFHTVEGESIGQRKLLKCNIALAAISSTRLSNIESELGLDDIESGDVGISYGIHLAIDGMPTGLRIDDWDRKGSYLKRYFVIVDAEMDLSNQLDPGRKGISQYSARMISEKVIQLINDSKVNESDSFAQYAAKSLDYGRGREEGGLPPQDFPLKISQVQESMLQLNADEKTLLEKVKKYSSLYNLPSDEQEVIALFYELLTQKIIKGYKTIYLSGSREVYDAGLEYNIECTSDNVQPNDPLGIGQVLLQDLKNRNLKEYIYRDHFHGTTTYPELCVEFKRNLGAFLDDVLKRSGRSSKDSQLIDLLITWDTEVPPSIPTNSYTIDPINDNRRIFHSTTHRLGLIREYNTEINCICLKDVILKAKK